MNLFTMHESREEEALLWKVILNGAGQYAVCRADQPTPVGWSDAGKSGIKAECFAYIREQQQREDFSG